jgi:hypothetical protein
MEALSYFLTGSRRATGSKIVPQPWGDKVIVFKSYFISVLHFHFHDFMVGVLEKFRVQIHQLTPTTIVVLSKFCLGGYNLWGTLSVEVFIKHYYLD